MFQQIIQRGNYMPLTKITNKEYLNQLSNITPSIFSEYTSELNNLLFKKPISIDGWNLTEVWQQGSFTEDATSLPTLKAFLEENLPNNIYLVMCVISSIRGGELTDERVHKEAYPSNMHRYHIPLHTCKNAFLNIQEDGDNTFTQYTWEEGFVYELENPQNNHYLSHNDTLDDRVIIILDVFEDYSPTQEELDSIYKIASSFIDTQIIRDS